MKTNSKFLILLFVSLLLNTSLKAQWTKIFGPIADLNAINFTSVDTGYTGGMFGKVLKTVNGGSTWNTISTAGIYIESMFFTSTNTGYVTGTDQTVKKTINGGISWVTQTTANGPSFPSFYVDISFPSTNIGYVVGQWGIIIKTVNGGANWVTQTSGTGISINSVYFVNDTLGYICGDSGILKKTTDGGANWLNQSSGTTKNLYSIYFTSALNGYAIGNGGVILKTTNGGTTWNLLTNVTNQTLFDVKFIDADTGYVVGAEGTILKTINAGAVWRAQPSGVTIDLLSISFPNGHTGYIAGSTAQPYGVFDGIVLKTTNGGGPTYSCAPVYITAQPQDFSVCTGNNATYTISAYGASPYSYRWYKNGVLVDSTISTSSHSNTYTASSLTAADSGSSIYCKITNRCWDNSTSLATSDTVNLSVHPACTPVSLVTPLIDQTFTIGLGGNYTFTITVAGTPPLIFNWFTSENNSTPILVQTDTLYTTSSTFSYPNLTYDGFYTIQCTVSNCSGCGSGIGSGSASVSSYAFLTIYCPYGSIDTQPLSQTKTTCQTATFSITAFVYGGNEDYGWFKNGVMIPGAHFSTYTTPALTSADNGNTYYCKVYWCNGQSWEQSQNATLTIINPAAIIQQPLNSGFQLGTTSTFTTSVNGDPPYSYYWYTNGVLSSSTLNTSSTNSTFTTAILTSTDIHNSYYCVIKNGSGCYSITSDTVRFNCANFNSISMTACDSIRVNGQSYTSSGDYTQTLINQSGCDSLLTIHLSLLGENNSIAQQPINQNFSLGNSASFTAAVNGHAPFSYFWYSNGLLLDSTINTTATSSTYSSAMLSLADIGNSYYCTVIFGSGCDTITSDTAHFICTSYNAISPVVCDSFSSNGQTFTNSGVYLQTLTNHLGCDSSLTINLTVSNLKDSVMQIGNALSSSISGVSYQWLDCEAAFLAIPGATNQTFVPLLNRYYAVVVYQGLCSDTSACFNVTFVGNRELDFENSIAIFPSPVKNMLQISSASVELSEINFYNSIGALLIQEKQSKKQVSLDLSSYAKGIYYVEIKTEKGVYRKKVIKE